MKSTKTIESLKEIIKLSGDFDPYLEDQNLIRNAFLKIEFDNQNRRSLFVITNEENITSFIVQATNLIRRVLYDSTNDFGTKKMENGRITFFNTSLGNKIYRYIKNGEILPFEWRIRYAINPYFQLYSTHLTELSEVFKYNLDNFNTADSDSIARRVNLLNDAISKIRKESKSPQFKTQIKNLQRNINKKRQGLEEYFEMIFRNRESVLLLRMELFYKGTEIKNQSIKSMNIKTTPKLIESAKASIIEGIKQREEIPANGFSIDEIINHRKQFLSATKDGLGNNLLGYIWKLDYSFEIGYRYHVIFCINEKNILTVQNFREIFTDLWCQRITGNLGSFYLYQAGRNTYRDCSVGILNQENRDFDQNITKMIKYLTRPELYLQIELPNNEKTFGRNYIKSSRKYL